MSDELEFIEPQPDSAEFADPGARGLPGLPMRVLLADPVTPTTGDMWLLDGTVRYYDGVQIRSLPRLFVSDTPPPDPNINDLWVEI